MDIFATNLKKAIKDKGFSQRKLADLLNVTQATISYYCTGTLEPNLQTLIKLCRILETTPNDLLDFHEFDIR